ncbi:hypothetical protein [Halalkalibacterium halodurans]|uniref:hypothetical protein n=1 Tax=Halalkalibacterium halodurans TaxID=86665 RepID=UPI002E1A99A5|nr:hypothetical protein [Halalkalibacterium halodurans]
MGMIRPATLEDTESLIPLMKDLGYPTKREHLYKRLEKLLSHRDYHLWLYVRKDSSPIGFFGFIHQLAFEKMNHTFESQPWRSMPVSEEKGMVLNFFKR